MVNNGSSIDLISNSLIQKLSLQTKQKQKIKLQSINGKEVASQGRWMMPGTLRALGVDLAKHSFYIAPTRQFEALVGLPWPQKMALTIDWAWGLLLLSSNKGGSNRTTASVASASFKILLEYADYVDLFDKETADVLPAHQEWDHKISLKKKKLLSYRPIYGLTPNNVEALRKEVDRNLNQGFIQLLTSPARALILFVKKKDGGPRLCVND